MRPASAVAAVAAFATAASCAPAQTGGNHTVDPLATATGAAPKATAFTGFHVTNTAIHRSEPGNTTICFTLTDLNPIAKLSEECSATWVTGSKGYPAEATQKLCGGNHSMEWFMDSFHSINSFTLGLSHQFENPKIGKYPYDIETTNARAVVAHPNITCTPEKNGKTSCSQPKGNAIDGFIWALS